MVIQRDQSRRELSTMNVLSKGASASTSRESDAIISCRRPREAVLSMEQAAIQVGSSHLLPYLKTIMMTLKGYTNIHRPFVVPPDGQNNGLYHEQREDWMEELNQIQLVALKSQERRWNMEIVPSLVTFQLKFGHCNVS
ncbi:hypothetical protein PsorP6_014907 [Peronosclerospora sorghi]|uniref:Uncharacterized protein n=1 Tax=Peronosclerospora sorghi TaxID=230839 RepID=A0ACC0VT99_9STRA|nr:hypothetical protein PsorP6_014907 [Peronosclerospora sorghi]